MAKQTEDKPVAPVSTPAAPSSEADSTRPEEKALADKLMEELKASGVDVAALAQQTPIAGAPAEPAPAPPAPAPAPPPPSAPPPPPSVPTSTPAPVPAVSNQTRTKPDQASPKKGFHLPHFSFKKNKTTEPSPAQPTPTMATPEAQQLTNEALMDMIDQRLTKISGDEFIVIKISKPALLIIVGVVLILVWISPLILQMKPFKFNLPTIRLGQLSKSNKPTPSPTPLPTPAPSPTPLPLSIRVRIGNNSLDAANTIKSLLAPSGATLIDVVYDAQVSPKQAIVVTRQGQDALREQLSQLLSKDYNVASEAATLTDDSDFMATIMVGKNSKLK